MLSLLEEFKTSNDGDAAAFISSYYPIPNSGEIDVMTPLLTNASYRDRLCLPVVAEVNAPLIFRQYRAGDPMVPSIASSKLLEP